tara:strand:- start:269 stop:547 length:279 start_codon:yes stop_codon:yes gene_type:complete
MNNITCILYKKENKQRKKLTSSSESAILEIGDLVLIKHSIYAPFYTRGDIKGIGIIVEVQHSSWLGVIYYVQTNDGIWRFSDYELELIDESR